MHEYDVRGNVIATTDALGNRTTFTYDSRNNKLTETNPLGHTTTFTYDSQDNLLTKTDPLGNTERFTYDARGQVLTATDALGRVTTTTYDARGNVTSTTDATGATTRTENGGRCMIIQFPQGSDGKMWRAKIKEEKGVGLELPGFLSTHTCQKSVKSPLKTYLHTSEKGEEWSQVRELPQICSSQHLS